jgi:hypothetical protein
MLVEITAGRNEGFREHTHFWAEKPLCTANWHVEHLGATFPQNANTFNEGLTFKNGKWDPCDVPVGEVTYPTYMRQGQLRIPAGNARIANAGWLWYPRQCQAGRCGPGNDRPLARAGGRPHRPHLPESRCGHRTSQGDQRSDHSRTVRVWRHARDSDRRSRRPGVRADRSEVTKEANRPLAKAIAALGALVANWVDSGKSRRSSDMSLSDLTVRTKNLIGLVIVEVTETSLLGLLPLCLTLY